MEADDRWKRLLHGLGVLNVISAILSILGLLIVTFFKDGGYFSMLFSKPVLSFRIPLLIAVVVSLLCLMFVKNGENVNSWVVFFYCMILLGTTVAMMIFSNGMSFIMTNLEQLSAYPNMTDVQLFTIESKLKSLIKRSDWIQLAENENCCGLILVDDIFGNNTEWESSHCFDETVTPCEFIIPISFFILNYFNPLQYPIINELDVEILISCLNVIVFVITIAYSLYYFTCFKQMMMYKKEPTVLIMSHSNQSMVVHLPENEIQNTVDQLQLSGRSPIF